MGSSKTGIFCLAALLFCIECVLSRPVQKRQTTQEQEQEPLQQEENDYILKFALLSRSSGKYLTMLKNGSVFASGLPEQGILDSSSLWYLHMTRDVYRLENVQSRDHYLSVAHRDNVTILVSHNLNEPFSLEMMLEQERILSGERQTQDIRQHNENNSTESSGSTFSFHLEWKIHSVDTVASNVKLVRDDTECYLTFDDGGYPHRNLCSLPSMKNHLNIVFQPIF